MNQSTGALQHNEMGTIFVAYGGGSHRHAVLETAVELASSGDHDVLVYHLKEEDTDPETTVRDEIRNAVEQVAPYVAYEIEIDGTEDAPDAGEPSRETRLLEAIDRPDREFEFVVLGDVDRGPVEQFTHPSLTRAVLNDATCPVTLVPV